MRPVRVFPSVVLAALVLAAASLSAAQSEPPGSIRFVGKNAIATAQGVFHQWKITASNVDLSNPAQGFVEVKVDVASLDTRNGRRDDHLRTGDFFEVEKYPTATARLHTPRATGSDAAGRKTYDVTVDLTIRDITHSVPASFAVLSTDPLQVEGELTIDRTRWGIGEPDQRFNPMAIGDDIPITFQATLGE